MNACGYKGEILADKRLTDALWRIYYRPEKPAVWQDGGNLPWNDPEFSRRMLAEHLDESHGAASRISKERMLQIDWIQEKLQLKSGARILDITCGPGLYSVELAQRGCLVTGIDFSPAAIDHARQQAQNQGLSDRCTFLEQDVRQADFGISMFDVGLFLYGQLAVFSRDEASKLLEKAAQALVPGGWLVVELLDQVHIDKQPGTWWFTDDSGLWGDAPFLHLGERFWLKEEKIAIERFMTLHLDSGQFDEVTLCDQSYAVAEMSAKLQAAGYKIVDVYRAWDGLPLYDAQEWIVYLAQKQDQVTLPD